jgi:hypothetical protein
MVKRLGEETFAGQLTTHSGLKNHSAKFRCIYRRDEACLILASDMIGPQTTRGIKNNPRVGTIPTLEHVAL